MSWQRKYDFQPGTRISSSQVDEELDQLIGAVNQNQSDIVANDNALRQIVQLTKITDDNGSTKLTISNTSQNLLTELVNLGIGFHTFYCISGAINNPAVTKSVRGLFHQTSIGFGWVYCQDSDGIVYENYINNNVWVGWKSVQDVLWTGVQYVSDTQTITPSKRLSKCRNGWILIWSDNDPGVGENNFDWAYSYIPKFMGINHSGQGNLFAIPRNPNDLIVKSITVSDTSFTGTAANATAPANDVVLRYVVEW